jgi:hypothetical protein
MLPFFSRCANVGYKFSKQEPRTYEKEQRLTKGILQMALFCAGPGLNGVKLL